MAELTPTDRLIDKLRRQIQPAKLFAVAETGERHEIRLGDKRGRWQRVARCLDDLDWATLECLGPDGELIDTLEPEPEPLGPMLPGPDPVSTQVNAIMAGVDRMVSHVRGTMKDSQDAQLIFIQTLVTRNNELETLASDALAALKQAAEVIHAKPDETLSPKDAAMLQAIDGISQRLLGTPPMQVPGLPGYKGNGNGRAAGTVGEVE